MTELTTPLQNSNDAETAALRQTLEQMRREAEQEVLRLNQQIAERSRQTNTAVASVTAQLALQQEMTILNQSLEVKEQALDHITEECRRLEDALEDQNIALDSLQQEVERKERALLTAREEIAHMRRELATRAPSAVTRQLTALKTSPHWRRVQTLTVVAALLVAAGSLVVVWREQFAAAWQHGRTALTEALAPVPVVELPAPTAVPITTPAAPLKLPLTLRDRLSSGGFAPKLAVMVGGMLQMGANRLSGEDFTPAHPVEIAPFLIGVTEVTYQDYDRFAQATGRALPDDFGWGRGARPVVSVSWQDANAYTAWLARETGEQYRLPSEAEWEFAARGGSAGSFWWGFTLAPGQAVCFDCGSSWDNRATAPVGSFAPNPFGLYDTAGNAMEWVVDCYHANYQGAPNDGRAWLDGDCAARVARGGAFNKPSASMRVYVRAHFTPETKLNLLGFRVARAR